MAKSRGRDPMIDLLKAIKDATKETTTAIKMMAAEEKLHNARTTLETKEFKGQQKALFERAQAYSQSGLGSVGHGMAKVGGMAQGLHGMGFTRAAGALSANAEMIGGAAGMTVAAANTAASMARIHHDPFMTADQSARAFAKMAPGGETVMNWADSFSGRAAGMELAKYHGQMAQAHVQARLKESAFNLSYNPEQAHYRGTAAAFAGGSAVTAGVFNRGASGGRTAFEDAQRMLPYRQATAKAERDMAASTASRLSSQQELARVEKLENALIRERVKVEAELAGGGSGVDRQVLHEQHKVITSQLEGYNAQVQQAKHAVVSATRGEAQAGGELSKAKIRQNLLGQADNLEARAQRSESSAGRLGGMDPFQRELGLQAIKMLESGTNPDFIPDQFKSAAQAFDPDAYDQAIKRAGVNTSQFKERQQAGKRGFEGDYASLYSQADTLREQAGKEEYRTDTKVAGELEKAGADLGDTIVKAINRALAVTRSKIDNSSRETRNQGGS